eukprot:CAMPEP_0203811344 /NCGR_PEP_ID=MMETSP0115-20131106/3505_1 /ASSEMBLY_ACC=CAM_ASM_000227 /TAXON_ID=33651 /ORGANISM="Bicosoecid sp, Strain ms1" /LENGTH=175 /DNA_ID=CAMNT_0050720169 /DNA_START=112 /DNA_END=636 /DNA_ORIENTATION=-
MAAAGSGAGGGGGGAAGAGEAEEPLTAREELMALMEKKDAMEEEIGALVAHLESVGVGLKESLVDAEGYPRADVDVHDVRIKRHRVAVLQTDHVAAMKRIEELLAQVHAEARERATKGGEIGASAAAARGGGGSESRRSSVSWADGKDGADDAPPRRYDEDGLLIVSASEAGIPP